MLPVEYLPAAERYFRKLRDVELSNKFRAAITDIRRDPGIGERKTGDLAGIYGYNVYHRRTNYEIAYRLFSTADGRILVIIMAGTRENFWRAVKSYIS